jgi:hypothetical protein
MGVSLLFAFAATLLLFSGHAQAQQQHQQQTRQQQQQHLTGHHGWAGRTTAQPMQMNQAQADAPLQEQQEQQWQPLPVAQHASDSQWTWEDIQVAQLMQQAQLRFMQLEQLQQQQQQLQQQNELAAASQPDEPQQLQPQQSAPTSDEALRSRGDAEDMLDDFFSPDRSHRRRGRSVPRRGVPVMSEPERDALLRRWKVDKKKEHDKLEEKLPSGEEESEDKKEEAKKEKKMDDDSSGNPPWRVACHQRCEERVMDVVGVGILSVPSDKAEVRATIEARRMVNTTLTGGTLEGERLDALISSVQTEVSLRANNVIRLLTGNGTAAPYVTRLRTSNLGLEPIYEYKEGRQWLAGYRASNSLTFRVDVPHAGSVLDAVVDAGVTRIDGVSYFASPEHIMQARFSAISAAVDDVMDQAMVRSDQPAAVEQSSRLGQRSWLTGLLSCVCAVRCFRVIGRCTYAAFRIPFDGEAFVSNHPP